MNISRWFGAALTSVAVASATLHAQPSTASRVRSVQRVIELPGVGPVNVTVGFLKVPENRKVATSRQIEIAFLRMHARPDVQGPPLIYLAGGPGDAAVTEDPGTLASYAPLLALGDFILVDQRGTGRSLPALSYRWAGASPLNLFLHADTATAFIRQLHKAALAHFTGLNVDLSGYNTGESADDIDDLRQAIGAERVNLMGFSYGTHLGLSFVRRHGDRVRNLVLIGTEGPAHTLKLPSTMDVQWRKLSLLVAADPDLATRIPDFNALTERVMRKLETKPMIVQLKDPRSGITHDIPVGAHGLRVILRRDIGDASDLPVFPRLLYSIDQGDPSVLTWFVTRRYALGTNLMSVAMDEASGVSPWRRALIDAEAARSPFGGSINFPDAGVDIGVPDLGEPFRSPIVSDVRTLFLSGTLDLNTPPFQAEEVRWGFPNSSHIIVRNAGHEQVLTHPNVQQAIARFLAGEDVDGTRAEWPPLRFVPLVGHDPARTHPSVRPAAAGAR